MSQNVWLYSRFRSTQQAMRKVAARGRLCPTQSPQQQALAWLQLQSA